MEEKVFIIDVSFARKSMTDLQNVNDAIINALSTFTPVHVIMPYGTFTGSKLELKLNKKTAKWVGSIFKKADYGPNINRELHWEMSATGTNRNFHFSWSKALPRYGRAYPVTIIIGGHHQTEIVRKQKNESQDLVDFLGKEVTEGDYVLMYSGPWELKETGSPFRMMRYTGKRSEKQAQFTYVKMDTKSSNLSPDGGQVIRVGPNGSGKEMTNLIYGVKVDVDDSLAVAMQMTDHDMSIYPIKFHVGMEE